MIPFNMLSSYDKSCSGQAASSAVSGPLDGITIVFSGVVRPLAREALSVMMMTEVGCIYLVGPVRTFDAVPNAPLTCPLFSPSAPRAFTSSAAVLMWCAC